MTTVPGAQRLGGNLNGVIGLKPWETTTLEAPGRTPIEITATPARHGPPASRAIVGTVIGFALRWDGQEHGALYVSGDTVLFDGVRDLARRFDIGTAILHLGGVRFPISGPVRYTMNAEEAVEACRLLGARTVVPVHYEGWSHFRQGRENARQVFDRSSVAPNLTWLQLGSPTKIDV